MFKLSRYEKQQKENNANLFKPLINDLLSVADDIQKFVEKLNNIINWNRTKDDLFIWIPILNKIDSYLNSFIKKYKYDDINLNLMNNNDEFIVISFLNFSFRLLSNTNNRYIYSSLDIMNNLLNCPNLIIKLKSLKILALMGERYLISKERIYNETNNILNNDILKKNILNLSLILPSSINNDKNEHFTLIDLFNYHNYNNEKEKRSFPSDWSQLKFNYYNKIPSSKNDIIKHSPSISTSSSQSYKQKNNSNSNSTNNNNNNKKINFKHSNNKSTLHSQRNNNNNIDDNHLIHTSSSLKKLHLNSSDLSKFSLSHLFNKGMEILPEKYWQDFSIKATIAKAFSEENDENNKLRELLVEIKFISIALINTIMIPPHVSSKLFEVDPYIFNCLTDFISLSDKASSKDLRLDALFALECISLKHVWCSDILRNLGGNMSHGLLFQILRYIVKLLREKSEEIDEEYNVRLFYIISNLSDVKTLHASLLSAGLISVLLEMVSTKNDGKYLRTLSSANHLLEILINDPSSTVEFINNDGFNILITSLTNEVNLAIDHPELNGPPPKYSNMSISISFKQMNYIASLLKLVLNLIKIDSSDRIRNLIDSPILVSLQRIFENKTIFGLSLITHSLDIVQKVINSEPTIYPILVEANIIPFIFDHFENFIGPNPDLLVLLPDLLSALCLNNEGLQNVKEKNLIGAILKAIIIPENAGLLTWKEEAIELGQSFDELARHYPSLKPLILDEFCNLIDSLSDSVTFSQSYLYESTTNNDYFYRSKTEEVLNDEPDSKELSFWDVQPFTPVIDCFADFFYGMTLENAVLDEIPDRLNFQKILSVIIMKRPPFDYYNSQTMLNFVDVLQLFDEQHRAFAFPILMRVLAKALESVNDFLLSPNDKSVILSATLGQVNSNIENLLERLSYISTLLYVLTEVYVNIPTLAPYRTSQIHTYFKEEGFDIIKNLRLLFQKALLEEIFIRERLPDEVVEGTLFTTMAKIPPLQIHVSAPTGIKPKDSYTSCKFKNTYQTRCILNNIQSCISVLFRSMLRLARGRDPANSFDLMSRELHVYDEIVTQIISMMKSIPFQKETIPYFLVVFHFNMYVLTFPKTTLSGNGILQTIPCYLFYQKSGYQFYYNVAKQLFSVLSSCEGLSSIEDINFVKNSEEILALSCLINVLALLNRSMQVDTMENFDENQFFGPVSGFSASQSLADLVRYLSLMLLQELKLDGFLFSSSSRKIPYIVFKQVLTLLKNSYTKSTNRSKYFFELQWDYPLKIKDKLDFLKLAGMNYTASEDLLAITRHKLPNPSDDKPTDVPFFSNLDWDQYRKASRSEPYVGNSLLFIERSTLDNPTGDLDVLRHDFYKDGLLDNIFQVLPFYPKLVNAFAKTLSQVLHDCDTTAEEFEKNIMQLTLNTTVEEPVTLSSLIHLFGIFLNDKRLYETSFEFLDPILDYFKSLLNPKYVNELWFSKALYVYEIVLAKSEIPSSEEITKDDPAFEELPNIMPAHHISDHIKEDIFNTLIRVNSITNFYSALATCRILILYSRSESCANKIINSGILAELLRTIGSYQKSEKINYLESSFLLLLRRCFETEEIVSNLIRNELNKSFTTRAIGDHREKERELVNLLEEKSYLVLRNPKIYQNIICEKARLVEFDEDLYLRGLVVRRMVASEEADGQVELKTNNTSEKMSYNRTGIVHLILSQLIAASKKDWLSEPPQQEEDNTSDSKKAKKVEPSRNPVCAYMTFLLKVLVELVSSYKQCKFEFLTFNKRNIYSELPKPRESALNFFLYQLVDKTVENEHNKFENKRKEVISMLARSVLVGFVATVQDDNNKKNDPKNIDPEMAFIRIFTIETIIKALKNSIASSKIIEGNVSKINAWFKIISSMVFLQAPYLRLVLDSNKIDADQYQICKHMIDLEVPSVITDCMAKFDLNHPFTKNLFNVGVDPLIAINSVRNSFSELFKVDEDEDDEEVESDKDEVPNMFKNSALGMYDVEDIEEDDEEEDSLLGDDEDIAFVDNDEGGYEVIFSDDEDMSNMEEDVEEIEEIDGREVDSSEDSEHFEVDHDGGSFEIESVVSDSDESLENESNADIVEYYSHNRGDLADEDSNSSDIHLSEYSIGETDWESGLSDLSTSGDDDVSVELNDANTEDVSGPASMRRWVTPDGIEIEDEEELSDGGEVPFGGIEHVFHSENQQHFRVQAGRSHSRSQQRSFRNQNDGHLSFGVPSLSILNVGRRHQSNLINPLGPSGLEEVENDISDQLIGVSSGVRPRTERSPYSGVLFSGESLDERMPDGIIVKSSVSRWKDIFDMFYDSRRYATYILNSIILRIYDDSRKLAADRIQEIKSQREGLHRKNSRTSSNISGESSSDEDLSNSDIEVDEEPDSDIELIDETNENSMEHVEDDHGNVTDDHEPVFVSIDGEEVDIGGTDIDPEFLRALPEEMRAEVFTEHVRERRAEAANNEIHSREVDADFLDAIPDDIREEILEQEAAETRINNIIETIRDRNVTPNEEETNSTNVEQVDSSKESEPKKKTPRIYFSSLVDRSGIAALMKAAFISQPYIQREPYHELFFRLCSSKQNRTDIINMLLLILSEGIQNQHSLERVFAVISGKANNFKSQNTPVSTKQLPVECTPLMVANQTIEILQNLIEADTRLKFYFITEHEDFMANKSSNKNKNETQSRNLIFPIKYLLNLLDKKVINDENVLMNLLTSIIQICTKPIASIKRNISSKQNGEKKLQIPTFTEEELKKLASIIKFDSCNTKVFQQVLSIMHNLSSLDNAMEIFGNELTKMATDIVETLASDLDQLASMSSTVESIAEIAPDVVQKFTIPSSNQSKLLKILTAVDYLYMHQSTPSDEAFGTLLSIYNNMNLGHMWKALNNCLVEFEMKKAYHSSATILLPCIESLMVVCKHTKSVESINKPLLKYEHAGKVDFSAISTDDIFFPFTDLHKKLLNQMIRSNPKLMSGPFSLLIKNTKILDFDNKRYYFTAKLSQEMYDRPKLSITVRRDQVFLDSYRALFFKSDEEIRKSKLEITFKGESGVDAGGLTREWYQVLSRQMFNPDYALFIPVASEKTTFRPNRTSGINPEHYSFFKFIGMIIGKAIRDQCYLDCHFSREVYKNILGKPVSLKDMESLDLDYYKSLIWILENDITDIIEETFSVETDDYGEHKIIDLIENGRNVTVTEKNKQDYVKRIVEYKLQESVNGQMDNFLQGFHALIPKELISIFDEQELELLISGLPDIDVDDWKNNTSYVNYTSSCKQIGYFWRAVKSFDTEERAKLLQFVTGTSKVPLNGFKELSGVNGICKFSIHRDYGSIERLPSSHTCFNQLDLPAYTSYEMLRGSLLLAINEGHVGFGIA